MTGLALVASNAKTRQASVKYLCSGIFVFFLIFVRAALGAENVAGLDHINQPAPADVWGPVQTEQASVANLAPALLPFLNNGPVFGLPGTQVNDFWDRTQLTGDWGGTRTELAHNGFF